MGRIFTTEMSGRSKERQELADTAIPLTAHLPVRYNWAADYRGKALVVYPLRVLPELHLG
jgi:hypothetical protein